MRLPRLRVIARASAVAVAIFAATGTARALAEDCSDFRMDGPGGSMEHVPARDQEGMGICYAEAGAQIADAIRFSRLGDRDYSVQTSGAATAAGISRLLGIDAINGGGGSCWALKFVNKYGICDQANVEGAGNAGLEALRDATLATNLARNSRYATPIPRPGACTSDGTPLPGSIRVSDELFARINELTSDLRPAAAAVNAACSSRRGPGAPPRNPFDRMNLSCRSYPGTGRELPPTAAEYKDKFAETLKPGGLPVEIHFCAEFLDGSGARTAGHGGCSPHAALMIGRRSVGGKCQYLVRNSWGTECDVYPEAERAHCEEGKGNIWIDSDTLAGRALGVVPPPELTPRPL